MDVKEGQTWWSGTEGTQADVPANIIILVKKDYLLSNEIGNSSLSSYHYAVLLMLFG